MDELLRERIDRQLERLPDDKAYQVLDYIEFLLSKYGNRDTGPSTLEKIADRVEDTMRAGRMSVSAIKGTRGVIDAAGKVMQGIADAGRTVLDELQQTSTSAPASKTSAPTDGTDATAADGEGAGETTDESGDAPAEKGGTGDTA